MSTVGKAVHEAGKEAVQDLSLVSAQCCCESKTVLKNKVYFGKEFKKLTT